MGATGQALAHGVDLVVCCGGDGTVRAVAAALAGTGVPLGVGRTGTGNLLARDLGLPLDLDAAVDVALCGQDRTLDVGVAGDKRFVVMADARHLRDRPVVLRLRVNSGPWSTRRVRGVIVANVGELQGGIGLLPDADPGDRLLDVALLDPTGLWEWARIAGRVLSGGTRQDFVPERFQVTRLELHARQPQPHELDGDLQAEVSSLLFEVDPAALIVRVPR